MPPTPATLNQFISRFCNWAASDDKARRARLSFALTRAVRAELPVRDGAAELEYRVLVGPEDLDARYTSSTARLYPNSKGELVVAVLSPDWRAGWRGISRDAVVVDFVRDFFHLARQYVARSRMAAIVGGLAFTYDKAYGFQSSAAVTVSRAIVAPTSTSRVPYASSVSDTVARIEDGELFSPTPVRQIPSGRRERELHAWIDATNALDPFVHRALFQFWRSTALLEHQFLEESVTALDGAVSIAAQFVKQRVGVVGNPRTQVASALGLSRRDAAVLEHLYHLRCDFGAHPSRSKWWDFGELYDEQLDEMRESVKRVLWNLVCMEQSFRLVEPNPAVWSEWFTENAPMVWDAVWFEHIR